MFDAASSRHTFMGHRARRSRRLVDLGSPSPIHDLFRPTPAYVHDSAHCRVPGRHDECELGGRVTSDRVASEWALLYHVLGCDDELAEVCGFDADELTPNAQMRRIDELRAEVDRTGSFTVRPKEMEFWVRFAWMSADRCSGRQHTLQQAVIRYLPDVRAASDMLAAVVEHAAIAMSAKHAPQSVITVMGGPSQPGRIGQLFVTEQLVRFEGDRAYRSLVDWMDASDPALIQRTDGVFSMFNVLPMLAVGEDGEVAAGTPPEARQYLIDIPAPLHPEWRLEHDFRDRFARWTAVPLQTNFDLDIAGQRYCVVFNGWYVDEEVAIDLLDRERYDLAEEVAMGLFETGFKLDEYRIMLVEIATLRAVRAAFKRYRYRLNTLDASQSAFGKFRERFLRTYGEEPPNDPIWTANRMLSRYRRPTHSMPAVRQQRGSMLVRHQLTHRSLQLSGTVIKHVDLVA